LSNNFFEEKRKNLGISKTHTHNQKRNQFEGWESKRKRERERVERNRDRAERGREQERRGGN
jgi:hypothetical protein